MFLWKSTEMKHLHFAGDLTNFNNSEELEYQSVCNFLSYQRLFDKIKDNEETVALSVESIERIKSIHQDTWKLIKSLCDESQKELLFSEQQ